MSKIPNSMQDIVLRNLIEQFVKSNITVKQQLSEVYDGLNKNSKIYKAVRLGEQCAYDLQVDILVDYCNDNPELKEDIFQRGLARTKAYLTTPLGKGFGAAKDKKMTQNIINAFKKNTERIVSAGPSPFAPSEEDQKNAPANISKVGALFGKRFANLVQNTKLTSPPTSAEHAAAMGRIEGLINKLKNSGLVKNSDKILDEIGIFARQHPVLTNSMIAGLTAALTIASAPVGVPALSKFLIGTALRTVLGIAKGESPQQAATKAAMVAGAGWGIGKLISGLSDWLGDWFGKHLGNAEGPSPIPKPSGPGPVLPPKPSIGGVDFDMSHVGREEYLSTYRQDFINKALNAPSAEEYQSYIQQVQNMDKQYNFNGDIPEYDPNVAQAASGGGANAQSIDMSHIGREEYLSTYRQDIINKALNAPSAEEYQSYIQQVQNMDAQYGVEGMEIPKYDPNVAQTASVGGVNTNTQSIPQTQTTSGGTTTTTGGTTIPSSAINLTSLRPQLDALNRLQDMSSYKGGPQLTGAYKQAINNWLNTIQTPQQAQALLSDKAVVRQLMKKGALGALKSKFNLKEWRKANSVQAEIDYIKAELLSEKLSEANPFTAAKNFLFGGPKVGGKNARLDYKQVESDYLKLLNNLERQFGVDSEDKLLDALKKNEKDFPGAYEYVMKVRNWLYGATPIANKPSPEPIAVPPREEPAPPTTPPQDQTSPTTPPQDQTAPPKPGEKQGVGYYNANLAKYLDALKKNPLFASGNLQQRIVSLLKSSTSGKNDQEIKASLATLRSFLINFSKAISNASAQYRKKVGDPNAIRQEITKDPQFAKLAESAADLLKQNKERQLFITQFNSAVPNIVGVAFELRQAFNRKNPNNIYNPPKLSGGPVPPKLSEDLESRGKKVKPNPGASGNLTGPDIANARAMFAHLINLAPILQKINPNSLDRATLKQLVIEFLDIGNILVYKKGSKKTNKAVDSALQGVDILGSEFKKSTDKHSEPTGSEATLAAADKMKTSATPEPKKKAWENEGFSLSDYKKFFL